MCYDAAVPCFKSIFIKSVFAAYMLKCWSIFSRIVLPWILLRRQHGIPKRSIALWWSCAGWGHNYRALWLKTPDSRRSHHSTTPLLSLITSVKMSWHSACIRCKLICSTSLMHFPPLPRKRTLSTLPAVLKAGAILALIPTVNSDFRWG